MKKEEILPKSLEQFYNNGSVSGYEIYGREYGKQRDLDCYYAELVGYIKVKLKGLRFFTSGVVGVPDRAFNWFYTIKDQPYNLANVISPDARVPNYTTNFNCAVTLGRKIGILDIKLDEIDIMHKFILDKANENKLS